MATKSVTMFSVVDAKKERDVMTMDILNAFVQTEVPQGDERIIMKIRGALVGMLLKIDPEKYEDFVIGEGQNKFLYVHMLNALCGMLMANMLCCNKFRKCIEVEATMSTHAMFELQTKQQTTSNML